MPGVRALALAGILLFYDGRRGYVRAAVRCARHAAGRYQAPVGYSLTSRPQRGGRGRRGRPVSAGERFRGDLLSIDTETSCLFNKDRFAAMKRGSVLVNVTRGEIVDEEALADALQRDHLRGAALDVYVEDSSARRRRGCGRIVEC